MAGHGGHGYAVTIKAGGGTAETRQALYDTLIANGPLADGWVPGRRGTGETFRVWKLDAGNMSAPEAAVAAHRARQYLDEVAQTQQL